MAADRNHGFTPFDVQEPRGWGAATLSFGVLKVRLAA
jgi:hypothetical protein